MKYPSIYLVGKGARGEVLSVAYAGKGMHDAGARRSTRLRTRRA